MRSTSIKGAAQKVQLMGLVLDKLARFIIGFSISVWVIRYLGPEDFGILNAATAIISILAGISVCGLNGVVVRDLVSQIRPDEVVIANSIAIQLAMSIFMCCGVAAYLILLESNPIYSQVLLIVAISILFKFYETFKYGFEARSKILTCLIIEMFVLVLVASFKISSILLSGDVFLFAWIVVAEAFLLMLFYVAVAGKFFNPIRIDLLSKKEIMYLIKEAWPIFISNMLVVFHLNVDKVFLEAYSGAKEVGYYAAAGAIVTPWYFIPVAIVSVFSPRIITEFNSNKKNYSLTVSKYYRILASILVCAAGAVTICSESIVSKLYGDEFLLTAPILRVMIWSIVFVFIVSFRGRLLIVEGKQKYVPILVGLATALNFILNYLLVPLFGGYGAAMAYTGSWLAGALCFPLLFKETRSHVFNLTGYLKVN